jgi:methylmalonyl-CoA mutase cobalamin-binding subunit
LLYKGRWAVSTIDKSSEVALSIGALANATGVPVDTLRTWERRYGVPAPINRTGGSHRRYAAETVGHVRLIVRALELGHRASSVVGLRADELRGLLGAAALDTPSPSTGSDRRIVARWLEHTRAMDGDSLLGDFQRALAEMPALEFLSRRMGPYLRAMGEAWAEGELRVSQEHFASERVREFLNTQWRGLAAAATGARAAVVFATPPGEEHTLGLNMAAWVVALAGVRVVFLGADTPMSELAFAVERYRARGAVLSVAAGYAGDLRAQLAELAALLPAGVSVVAGGDGSVPLTGEPVLNRFEDLFEWACRLPAPPRP